MSIKAEILCDNCSTLEQSQTPPGWWTLTCRPITGGGRENINTRHLCPKCADEIGLIIIDQKEAAAVG